MTQIGDLVLVHMEGSPAFFARIEDISGDVKPEWFQVKMLVLQVPLLVITWILREAYINGDEFTMGGRPMRLEKVVSPEAEKRPEVPAEVSEEAKFGKAKGKALEEDSKAALESPEKRKVVSMMDRLKKDQSS